jgi:hypothetical protein
MDIVNKFNKAFHQIYLQGEGRGITISKLDSGMPTINLYLRTDRLKYVIPRFFEGHFVRVKVLGFDMFGAK